jgi:leukotriene-A4 hydrolase
MSHRQNNCSKYLRRLRSGRSALQTFTAGTPAAQLTTTGWTTHHWLHFIRNLPAQLDAQKMADLDATFHFSDSGNSEILGDWFVKVIGSKYEPAYPALERFLTTVGRRPAK